MKNIYFLLIFLLLLSSCMQHQPTIHESFEQKLKRKYGISKVVTINDNDYFIQTITIESDDHYFLVYKGPHQKIQR